MMMKHILCIRLLKSKVAYDEVMRFGKYHPDYQKVMLETRRRKELMKYLPVVMDYKSKEVALQNLIDEVVSKIAFSVSKNVKIEAEIHSSKQVMMDVRQVALVIVVCHKIRRKKS